MIGIHEEKLLILTKTYPIPSSSYRETVCVAAVNDLGELRRLYPISFRLLKAEDQFKRWEWITARIYRDTDKRPESYRIDSDSIKRLYSIDTNHTWAERLSWVYPHLFKDFQELENERKRTGQSLGFLHPNNYRLIIDDADSTDWPINKFGDLPYVGLLDDEKAQHRPPLRKVPYSFYYEYEFLSDLGIQKYRHKINDWEITVLYWRCEDKYGSNWEKYFRKRIEEDFKNEKDLFFLMGNIKRFPHQWLIIGLVYPPKTVGKQLSLLNQV